jgi:hypothetical protein
VTFLRYARTRNGLKISEHDTLDELWAAQLLDDRLGIPLDIVERVDGDTREVVDRHELMSARPNAPHFVVAVNRPGHGHAVAGVYGTQAEAHAERDRWTAIVGADRVSTGTLQ